MIICLYVFLFGIMGTIDSINVSIGAEETPETPVLTAPAVTSNVNEEGMAVYTYATEINVINAKKPVLADYTNTETMLLIPDETAATSATTTTSPVDFEMAFDDFCDFFQVRNDFRVLVCFGKGDANESADIETQGLRLDHKSGAGNHSVGFQSLDPLMDGSSGDTAFTCDLEERHPCVVDQE